MKKLLRNSVFFLIYTFLCFVIGYNVIMLLEAVALLEQEGPLFHFFAAILLGNNALMCIQCYGCFILLAGLFLLALRLHNKEKALNKIVFIVATSIGTFLIGAAFSYGALLTEPLSFGIMICIILTMLLVTLVGSRIFDTISVYVIFGVFCFWAVDAGVLLIKDYYFPVFVLAIAFAAFIYRLIQSFRKRHTDEVQHALAHSFLRLVSVIFFSAFARTHGASFLAQALPYGLMIVTGFSVYPLARSITNPYYIEYKKVIPSAGLAVLGISAACLLNDLLFENTLSFFYSTVVIVFTALLQLGQLAFSRLHKHEGYFI